MSSATEDASDIQPAASIQGDSFFDSWLGDDVWSSSANSPAATQTTLVSSEDISTPGEREWKTKLLSSGSRQKTPELKSKSQSVTATSFNRTDVGSTEAKEKDVEDETSKEKDVAKELDDSHEKAEGRSQLGFTTSFMSAFEQVRQSKPMAEDVEPSEDLCLTQTESDSRLPTAFFREGEKLIETEKNSSVPVRHVEVSSNLSCSLDSEQTSEMPKSCLDEREVPITRRTDSTVEQSQADKAQENTEVSGELQLESALQMEDDAGWADVSLNLLAQDGATHSCDIELATDEEVPVMPEVAIESSDDATMTLPVAPESSLADVVDDNLKQSISWADVSMQVNSGGDNQSGELDMEAMQNPFDSKGEFCSGLQDVIASVASNASSCDIADKKDALKSVSSSMLSSSSETDIGLKDVVSLEGSLAASDELSESNKTLTGDDLDATRDDTDIDELKQGEELDGSQLVAVESNDASEREFVTFEMGKEEPEENDGEQKTNECLTESPTSCDVMSKVAEGLTELTVNTEGGEKLEPAKNDDSPRSNMSGSSYVRNLLEEAMAESSRESSNTDNSHGSEAIRESEYTSGHTSADEIDTTTSSDIEIISHISTPNSNFRPLVIDMKPYDVSPSKAHAWSRSMRSVSPHGHKRSDSGSSAQSLQSRNGEELVSPEGGLHRAGADDHSLTDDRTWRTIDQRLHGRRNPGVDVNKRPTSGTTDQGDPLCSVMCLDTCVNIGHTWCVSVSDIDMH